MEKFWAGGFLYNPETKSVLLHKRDLNTKFNPGVWAFFGGLNEGKETPVETFIREINEEIGLKLEKEEVITLTDYLHEEFQTHRFAYYAISQQPVSKFKLGEGAGLDWISLDKLREYKLTKSSTKDLRLFIEKQGKKS